MSTELQPTPETDAAMVRPLAGGFHFVPLYISRKLERERDQARRERDEAIASRERLRCAVNDGLRLSLALDDRDALRAELARLKGETP